MTSAGFAGRSEAAGRELSRIAHLNGSSFTAKEAAQTAAVDSISKARLGRASRLHF